MQFERERGWGIWFFIGISGGTSSLLASGDEFEPLEDQGIGDGDAVYYERADVCYITKLAQNFPFFCGEIVY